MNQKIVVQNFGPIIDAEFEISDFTLFIGTQACGKSTLAKSVFFFKSLRDDLLKYILAETNKKNSFSKPLGSYAKKIRQKYLDYWGPTFHLNNIYLKYFYSEELWIELTLEKDTKFVTPTFSPKFIDEFNQLINSIKFRISKFQDEKNVFLTNKEIIQFESEKNSFIESIERSINKLFKDESDLLFIPAGRSLLSTLSEQIQFLDTRKLDFLMRSFVERIVNVKRIFSVDIDELVIEKKKLTMDYFNKQNVQLASELISKILKGKYRSDRDGEKIFIDSHVYTKLNFSSSGQQESVWILNLLFLIILENQKTFIVIEEPEAHLFPIAQNDMAKLITLLNNSGCQLMITTHSPYILSSFNSFLFAGELSGKNKEKVEKVLPKQFWLNSENCQMYLIEEGKLEDVIEQDIKSLKTELIDNASVQNNTLYTALFEIE